MMPLSDIVYEFPSLSGEPFLGMPGLVADSLPDTFGNKVIEQWLVKQGRSIKEFFAIDRLCYTGKRGMGALEYVPASSEVGDINENINVSNNGDHGLEDVPEYTLIEFAYYKMALEAGVQMNECRLYSNNGEHHFMTKRFDRVAGKKIHM